MTAIASLKRAVKGSPLAPALIRAKALFRRPTTQNEEAAILQRLLARYDPPKLFVEFGFSGWEFNCAGLVDEWTGLLLDGNAYNVTIARSILPKTIAAKQLWITRESLSVVREYVAGRDLGILSIDVDGNDYWFLEGLIDLKPAIIVAEYNSFFGTAPVTVPYDPAFDRTKASPDWTYFGASLAALTHLAEKNGYALVEVGASGINAFFVRSDLLHADDRPLNAAIAYRERTLPPGTSADGVWERIKHLPFVDVTTA